MYRALKPMTLNGVQIQPGEPVHLEHLFAPTKEQRIIAKLVEQKRIVFAPEAPTLPQRRGRPPKRQRQEA